ncbi:MAG: nodulation protein NfeD [Halobacteriota archaeon]
MTAKLLRGVLILLVLIALIANVSGASNKGVVYVLKIDGVISDGTALYVVEGLKHAEEKGAEAVLIELDTPGGVVESTRKITEAILNSQTPVITYVTPKGAIAASAGSFILISGNIAAMAPGTTTGAAMPVIVGIGGRKAADNKTIKFYAGYVGSIAASRDRNATQAKLFVTDNDVLDEHAALKRGIIDLTARDDAALLNAVEGMTVNVGGENMTLATKDASLYIQKKSTRFSILKILGNPEIAFILLMVGIYGLIFGFMSPGTYVPETIGAVCLILALYGMGFFDVNIFGVFLIIIAVILFIAEALTPTFGILTISGVICLIIGALILPNEPLLFTSQWFRGFVLTVLGVAGASAAFFFFAIGAVLKTRKSRIKVGGEELIGQVTKADTEINGERGTIKIRGEIWNARTQTGEVIKEGEKVEILAREGLTLMVKRKG